MRQVQASAASLEAVMAVALKEVLLVQEVLVLAMEGVAVALGQEKVALALVQEVLAQVQEEVHPVQEGVAVALEVLVLGQEGAELAVAVDQEDYYMEGSARLAS